MRARAARLACGAICLSLLACSGEPEGPSAAARADVKRLRRLFVSDPAAGPLEEVERVATDRPVLGARLLRRGGIPAAERQLTRVEEASFTTEEGRRLARQAEDAYRQRLDALRLYADVLEGAASDTEGLLDALRGQREAEMALLALDRDMEAVVPTARGDDDRARSPAVGVAPR